MLPRRTSTGRVAAFASLVATTAFLAVADANGRPPGTSTINFKRGDESKIVAGLTFGLLVSNDAGATWRWMCEAAVGYGGVYDPDYVFAPSGTLFATTFGGLKARRDECVFGPTPAGDKYVATTTLGPDGAIYFASIDPMDAKVYKSIDDGVSFPISSTAGQMGDTYTSLEVAPSDPARLYLTGHRLVPTGRGAALTKVFLLFTSVDGALSWSPLPVSDFAVMQNSTLEIAAVGASDPDLVFARVTFEDNSMSQAIYRSTNGGQSWTRILGKDDTIGFVLRKNGDLVVGTRNLGMVQSTDNGATWQDVAGAPHVNCLVENSAGEVWACTQNYGGPATPSDDAAIMKTTDLVNWVKVARYQDIQAPVDCLAGTVQHDMCDALWCGVCEQLGCDPKRACPGFGDPPADAPPDKTAGSGCCDSGGIDRSGVLVGLLVVGLLLRPVRDRRAASDRTRGWLIR